MSEQDLPHGLAETINRLATDADAVADAHGWNQTGVNVCEQLMLVVTEAAEAVEDYRSGHDLRALWFLDGKPQGFPSELADIIIRTAHLAKRLGIDLGRAIEAKHEYNKTRPFRHGGKLA